MHILIDFENVPPVKGELERLEPLAESLDLHLHLFVGAKHAQAPTMELVSAIQPLGKRAAYVQSGGVGKNAADFHLVYYLGEIAAVQPESRFWIISKDSGYDPLIKHLRSAQRTSPIAVSRKESLTSLLVALLTRNLAKCDARAQSVIHHLFKWPKNRPKTAEALRKVVSTMFKKDNLEESALARLIDDIKETGFVSINANRLHYADLREAGSETQGLQDSTCPDAQKAVLILQ